MSADHCRKGLTALGKGFIGSLYPAPSKNVLPNPYGIHHQSDYVSGQILVCGGGFSMSSGKKPGGSKKTKRRQS